MAVQVPPPVETKVRQVRGMINAAREIYVWVAYGSHENACCPLQITRPKAREICDDAKENGIETIAVTPLKNGRELYIGDVDMSGAPEEDEGPEEEDGVEEEEDFDEEEEDVDEEEEEEATA